MSVDISIDVGARLGVVPAAAMPAISAILDGLRRQWRERLITTWFPVNVTGRSLQGWQNRIVGLNWILRNPVEYAQFVHYSGSKRELWRILERDAHALLQAVMPEMKAIVRSFRGVAPQPSQPAPSGLFASLLFRARSALNESTGRDRRARDLRQRQRPRRR